MSSNSVRTLKARVDRAAAVLHVDLLRRTAAPSRVELAKAVKRVTTAKGREGTAEALVALANEAIAWASVLLVSTQAAEVDNTARNRSLDKMAS